MQKFDYSFFQRRYELIEEDFLDITDFIEMEQDFNSPCYKFGSSKLMDFCLKVNTEIETLFRILLNSNKFDSIHDIQKKRAHQNIKVYQTEIESKYKFRNFKLFVNHIKKEIVPFEKFDQNIPPWFRFYSKYKHDKLILIKRWNLKYALLSLGALLILVTNHPDLDNKIFKVNDMLITRVFNKSSPRPRFATRSHNFPLKKFEDVAIGDKVKIQKENGEYILL